MPVSKNKRKNGKSATRGRSIKTERRRLRKVRAQHAREQAYRRIRELQKDMEKAGVEEAFKDALTDI